MKIKIPSGEKITHQEYMKRWKAGIMKVGLLSQTKIQVRSTWIIVIGLLAGIVISLLDFKELFWLFIILIGALGNTAIQLIALIQKRNLLDRHKEVLD